MARAKSNGRLEEALTALTQNQAALQHQSTLMQNQAAFLARAAEIDARVAELAARVAEMDRINTERFARIEALLLEHNRILQWLPDAIRDKIGFNVSGS